MPEVEDYLTEEAIDKLDKLEIELPSWGFWRGGTRFETYSSGEEPRSIEERIRAAGKIYRLTGKGRKVSLHFLWDGKNDEDVEIVKELLANENLEAGGINANLFSMRENSPLDSRLRFGSFISPFSEVREGAVEHVRKCIKWMRMLDSKSLVLWLPDGTNYFGQMSFFDMFKRTSDCIEKVYKDLNEDERILIEYKPFEPSFYSTAIFDWGTAEKLADQLGDRAKVLVDVGHHLQGANVEQIIAYLLKLGDLGGLHLNDWKYADDDLVTGSISPKKLFRLFCVLRESVERDLVDISDISVMLDQDHRIKKPEMAIIESIENILIAYSKSLLLDFEDLRSYQSSADVSKACRLVRDTFWTDTFPIIEEWKKKEDLPKNPLEEIEK